MDVKANLAKFVLEGSVLPCCPQLALAGSTIVRLPLWEWGAMAQLEGVARGAA